MTPILIPMLIHSNGGNLDGRKRCSHCGQVMPKDRKFIKWLNNSFWGIGLTTCGLFAVGGFILWSSFFWFDGGNAWADNSFDHADRSLVQCLWMNLIYIWHLLGRVF